MSRFPSGAPPGFAGRIAVVALVCLASIATAWFVLAERVAYEERTAMEDAQRGTDRLAIALEQQTLRQVQSIDQLVRFVRHEYHGNAALDLREVFGYGAIEREAILHVAVVDAYGLLAVSSDSQPGLDLSDRDYFRFHAGEPEDRLLISQPSPSRTDGRMVIHFSRRLSDASGAFRGVALVGIAADYLAQGARHFDIGQRGQLILLGEDGVARARRIGEGLRRDVDMTDSTLFERVRHADAGSFVSRGRTDGVPRFMSFRRVSGYGLIAAVGVPVDEALAAVRARSRIYYASGAAGTIVALLVAALLLAALLRQKRTLDERRRAEERYRATFDQAPVGIAHQAPDGSFITVNRKFCDMLGYTQAELLTKRFTDILLAEDAARSHELAGDFFACPEGARLELENRHVRKDGSVFLGAVTVGRVAAADGRPYVVVMVEDITEKRAAETALRQSEERLAAILDSQETLIARLDMQQRVTYMNQRYAEAFGLALGDAVWSAVHPADEPLMRAAMKRFAEAPFRSSFEVRCRVGAEWRWIHWQTSVIRDARGVAMELQGVGFDVTDRRRAEERSRQAEARYRATFDQAAIGVAHASLDGTFLTVNRKLAAMLGYPPDEVVGRKASDFTLPEDRHSSAPARAYFMQHPGESLAPEYEKRYLRKDGSTLWVAVALSLVRDAAGVPEYVIALVKDVSARREAEERLVRQAHYDPLTQLPNRTLFYDRLSQTLSQARRHGWTPGVIIVDLDRFNIINDTLGHERGDRLLAEVAKRLALCVRGGDTVARLGGDEFGVIAADLASARDAALVARKVTEALIAPFELDGQEVFVSASAGIATYPVDGLGGGALIKAADAALFRAKELGRNNYQFATGAMNEHATDRLKLETDLRRALERSEFLLHFQPKARLADGAITGFEALLRWQRPGNGLVPPGQFVPLLEETGLIMPVGDWVIDAACAQLAAWRRAGLPLLPIAVNLAAKQFLHRDISTVVEAALRAHQVPAACLELEITESDAMHDPEAALATLEKLAARGVRISIDDFGTGYSSLAQLKRLPVDTLKLDRSFVQGLPQDAGDASIARAVITMAHSLGLAVVAEGVETAAQREFLAAEGCDQMQGYLLSRPVPAAQCGRLLRAAEATAPASA